jgi:hypothetical protein
MNRWAFLFGSMILILTVAASVQGAARRRAASPPSLTAGDKLVSTYFDLVRSTRFHLSNRETYCWLNGCPGIPSFRATIAEALWSGPSDTWSIAQYESWLAMVSNGLTSTNDIELYHCEDPFTANVNVNAISFGVVGTQTGPPTFLPGTYAGLSTSQMTAIVAAARSFLVMYVNTHPEEYPDLADPTWRSRDPNPCE